jgi:hypothetical protein
MRCRLICSFKQRRIRREDRQNNAVNERQLHCTLTVATHQLQEAPLRGWYFEVLHTVHAPPAIDEGQLPSLDESTRQGFGFFRLLAEPPLEESLLDVGEGAVCKEVGVRSWVPPSLQAGR